MRVFIFLFSLFMVSAAGFAQPGPNDSVRTKSPNDIRYLQRLLGKRNDSAELRIRAAGYHYSSAVTQYWELRDKLYYKGYSGNTSPGRVIEIGCDKDDEVVYASFNGYKEEYKTRLADSLTQAGYSMKSREIEWAGQTYKKEIWEMKDGHTFTMMPSAKGFYNIVIMTRTAARLRKGG